MKDRIALLGIMASALGGAMNPSAGSDLNPEDIDVTPKELPIPKGCKRYYFNEIGICHKGYHLVYFDALKEKTAFKKYKKWKLNSEQGAQESDTTEAE